ncbi:MAG TPA: YHS domain-containing protein [Ghiorsea sp.]|nr:YHS domain-containing protein [Ghiorsea sp.]HIP06387.1 YHS domain-containing protein [Mariprofundaceae bacterium]
MNMDPVCGMKVKPETARYTAYHEQDWFFCSEKCQHKFEDNPEQYTVDPVCQMFVKPTAIHRVKHADTTYRFCSEKCFSKFSAAPETYLAKHESCEHQTSSEVEHVSGSGKYTCPMHPEVVSDKPDSCPKCGMALEPRTVSAEDDNTELNDMSRRFKVSAVLSIPVFILAMVADLAPSWLPSVLNYNQM